MDTINNFSDSLSVNYCGKILTDTFSDNLKKRVRQCIKKIADYEATGVPSIPYISAWQENKNEMWYEYVSQKFCKMFNCSEKNIIKIFKESIIDRRVYQYKDVSTNIQEEILSKKDLKNNLSGLREQGKITGSIDAVYQVAVKNGAILWLKDQANIETFTNDTVCISLGCLTNVTKEMEQKALLEKIGYFDELTRLPKRNIMNRIIEVNISQLERKFIKDFVFLMIDIDHFKLVNDNFGHLAGDYVLATISEVMTASKRKGDEIGRYGGEEFYALTHGDIQAGCNFAERLRQKVERTPFVFDGNTINITISIGLVAATELKELSIDNFIAIADQRLYSAKKNGRNQVMMESILHPS